MRLKKYLQSVFEEGVKAGGVLVSDEQYEARVKVCETRNDGEPCEYLGVVEPLPTMQMIGCTKCGCPFSTKAYFDRFKLTGHKVKCPHQDGNMWASVDQKFSKR